MEDSKTYVVGDQISFLARFPRGRKGVARGRVVQLNPDGTLMVVSIGRESTPRKLKWNGKQYEIVD